MQLFFLVIHVLIALAVIGLVLLQHGKGADMGAAFGSGSAGGLFGASGSANFLSRTTAVLAALFFLTSLTLTWLSTGRGENKGVVIGQPPSVVVPSASAPAAAVPVVPSTTDTSGKAKEIPK